MMDCAQLRAVDMTRERAAMISQWKYDGIYAFYDHNSDHEDEFMDGAHFACIDPAGSLIGYYCFGDDARIPTLEEGAYEGEYLDVGLGLRPDLCGRGLGQPFMALGLDFAERTYHAASFRLSVAAFNGRAIRLYEKIGFRASREVTNAYFRNKFLIMTCAPRGEAGRIESTSSASAPSAAIMNIKEHPAI